MSEKKTPLSTIWIIGISLIIPIIPFILIGELPGEKWLSNVDDNSFVFGLIGAGLLASDIILPIPSTIIGTMLGGRLDFFAGFIWSWCGLIVGNLIGYYMGKLFLQRSVEAIPESPTLLLLAISRPIPILAEAVTFAAGASEVRFNHFLYISVFSNAVFAAVLAKNGATLDSDNIFGVGLLIPILLPGLGWIAWKVNNRLCLRR